MFSVILSGGAGARLWPISRDALPMPFIKLADGETLLRKTMRRAIAVADGGGVLAVTNCDHYFLTRDEYEALGEGTPVLDFLLEPVARNTAPAICAAALHAQRPSRLLTMRRVRGCSRSRSSPRFQTYLSITR